MADNQKTRTRPSDIVKIGEISQKEDVKARRKLTTTRVGYYLAVFVLGYLALVTIILFVDSFHHVPSKPTITGLSTDDLNNYSELSNIALERTLRLFEQIVEKSMLPVLTAILGYIFGVHGVEKEER